MTRDMEIVRSILLKVEEKCPPAEFERFDGTDFPMLEWNAVWAHAYLMEQKGLFQNRSQELGMDSFSVDGLSWEGHDFLESVRDDEIWKKTKSTAIEMKNFGYDTLKQIAKAYFKKKFNEQTGLDIN